MHSDPSPTCKQVLPSAQSSLDVLQEKPGSLVALGRDILQRAALIGAGLALAGERDSIVKKSLVASAVIEAFVLWEAKSYLDQQESGETQPIMKSAAYRRGVLPVTRSIPPPYRGPGAYLGAYDLEDALEATPYGINTRGGVRGYGPTGPWGSYSRHQAHMEHNPEYQRWYGMHRDMYRYQPNYHQQWDYRTRPLYYPSQEQPQTYYHYRYGQGNPYLQQQNPHGYLYSRRTGRWI